MNIKNVILTLATAATMASCNSGYNDTKKGVEEKSKSNQTEILSKDNDIVDVYKDEQFNIPFNKEDFQKTVDYISIHGIRIGGTGPQSNQKIYDIIDNEGNQYRFMTVIKESFISKDERGYYKDFNEGEIYKICVFFSEQNINDEKHNNLDYEITNNGIHDIRENDSSNIHQNKLSISNLTVGKIQKGIDLIMKKVNY